MPQLFSKLVLSAGLLSASVTPFQLRDTQGRIHTSAEWSGQKAILLFFVTNECPLANSYVPEMNRIEQAYAFRGVRSYAVQADASVSAAVTTAYARDYQFDFPLLIDPQQVLVRLAGATVTPQAVVLSPAGKVLYRGRIDNRVADFGSQCPRATIHDLPDALDAVLAGHLPEPQFTHSIGCAISLLAKK
jgi:peroxiredoxin